MSPENLLSQIQTLELNLAVLKAQVKQFASASPQKTAAGLYGVCAGQSATREEDLEAVEYRVKWEDEPDDKGPT